MFNDLLSLKQGPSPLIAGRVIDSANSHGYIQGQQEGEEAFFHQEDRSAVYLRAQSQEKGVVTESPSKEGKGNHGKQHQQDKAFVAPP